MPAYSASIHVDAPPDVVYARVADLTSHGTWSADPLEIIQLGDGTFRSTTRAKGKEITAELTVVDRVPPQRFVFDAADLTGRWRHTFTLSPVGGGTRVRREISGSLSGAQLVLYWIVLVPIKKPAASRALARLKQSIERER